MRTEQRVYVLRPVGDLAEQGFGEDRRIDDIAVIQHQIPEGIVDVGTLLALRLDRAEHKRIDRGLILLLQPLRCGKLVVERGLQPVLIRPAEYIRAGEYRQGGRGPVLIEVYGLGVHHGERHRCEQRRDHPDSEQTVYRFFLHRLLRLRDGIWGILAPPQTPVKYTKKPFPAGKGSLRDGVRRCGSHAP